MNTQQLFHYHLAVSAQSNKCADICRLINRVRSEILSIEKWITTPNLDGKVTPEYIRSQMNRSWWLQSKVIPRLMSYYQSQLIKLEQIYRA